MKTTTAPSKTRRKPKDEPLVTKREEKRNSRSCYGYIPGGPVRSVFELASAGGV